MKARLLLLLSLFVLLFVLTVRNYGTIRRSVIDMINPIKTNYSKLSREVKNKRKSLLAQKDEIEKLTKENRILRKYLLDQTHYLRQVAQVYKKLPSLVKLPYKNIVVVDTISYIKLNKFDEILLTIPKKDKLEKKRVYGLIQEEVVGGTARLENGHLYGYLISNPRCRFGVFIGRDRVPGIAEGIDKDIMAVKYIPKWSKVKAGDRVETSGLDNIFFANIPVGVVKQVMVEGSYKKAYITPYADTVHPEVFFLITDTKPYLVSYYDKNSSFPDHNYTFDNQRERNITTKTLSSVPETVQTRETEVDMNELEPPAEENYEKANVKKSMKKEIKAAEEPIPEKAARERQLLKKNKRRDKKHPSPFDILRSRLYEL